MPIMIIIGLIFIFIHQRNFVNALSQNNVDRAFKRLEIKNIGFLNGRH